jgi:exoribonuclease-2
VGSDQDGLAQLRGIAREVMLARGLLPDFSPAARAQTEALANPPTDPDPQVRDLRRLLWASIDNDDSRDLDQLTVAEPLPDGHVKVLVAVADVDAAVKPGTPIDEHARANTTTVYTTAQIFPMLPERLSTDFTSLGEGVERLALVIEMTCAPDGTLKGSGLYRARVVNQAKLAYRAVGAWLAGSAAAPPRVAAVAGLAEQLRLQDRVAQTLKQVRHEHGALTLETLEPRPVIEGGALKDLRQEPKNRAEELIEDFMIAANSTVAGFLDAKGLPSLRRIVRTPKRWDRIVALAATLGERLPAAPDARALNSFLTRRRTADPDRFPDLSLSVVKLLGSGEYVLDRPGEAAPGHFGLAVRDYTHSTAPNRRFADLITQRLLKAALAGVAAPYAEAQLAALAARCTQQEDNAAKVERQVGKSAAALLLNGRIGERFEAIVTGINETGTWVRIFKPTVEGKLVRGFQGLDVGDRLSAQLVHTDVARGFIDFTRAP